MNDNASNVENPSGPTWQQSIDRLVDGELGDAQSRQLLALLDGIEGGWRRLALAYVEAQWLSRDLPSLLQKEPVDSAPDRAIGSAQPAAQRAARTPRPVFLVLAVAASMLVGFLLSLWQRGGFFTPATPVANSSPQSTSDAPDQPGPEPSRQEIAAQPMTVGSPATLAETRHVSPQEPTLVVLGSSGEADNLNPVVPPRVVEALRRRGHQVDQRSGVMPVRLNDGRRIDVPYEQLEVQNPGGDAFQ